MIISPFRTSVTKQHQDGKRLADCEVDMSNRRSKDALRQARAARNRATEDKLSLLAA